jgi:hypothetical protein
MLAEDMAEVGGFCNSSFFGVMDTFLDSEVNFSTIPYPQLDMLHTSWDSRYAEKLLSIVNHR